MSDEEKIIHAKVIPDEEFYKDTETNDIDPVAYKLNFTNSNLRSIRNELYELNKNLKELIKVEKSKK